MSQHENCARADKLFTAKVCEQAERYEDMVSEITSLVLDNLQQSEQPTPTIEERNLLTLAYRNVLYYCDKAYGRVITISQKYERNEEDHQVELTKKFANKMRDKTIFYVHQLIDVIDQILKVENLPLKDSVYYWKCKADFCKYGQSVDYLESIYNWKKNRYELSRNLPITSPERLGTSLNYSVFCSETFIYMERGISIACPELDEFMKQLEEFLENDDDENKDALLIAQLLRDNMQLWASEQEQPDDED